MIKFVLLDSHKVITGEIQIKSSQYFMLRFSKRLPWGVYVLLKTMVAGDTFLRIQRFLECSLTVANCLTLTRSVSLYVSDKYQECGRVSNSFSESNTDIVLLAFDERIVHLITKHLTSPRHEEEEGICSVNQQHREKYVSQ